jgi:hypothetical protein
LKSKLSLIACLVLALYSGAHAQPVWTPDDAEFVTVSEAASPSVRYAVKTFTDKLELAVEVATFSPDEKVRTEVGVLAAKKVVLSSADAKLTRRPDAVVFRFSVPAKQLIASADDWGKLHLAFTVAWESTLPGIDRQRERFLHADNRAPHDALSPDPSGWQPLDLTAHQQNVTARKNRILLSFNQPLDGKATIVIENEKGERVRNLESALPLAKGRHEIAWDVLNEDGHIAPPGEYRWRAVSHAGIAPQYLMTFAAGPASNHGVMHTAASNATTVFLGTAVSEGGHQIVGFDASGKTTYTLNPPLGAGLSRAALAADENFLYVAKDGPNWGDRADKSKPDWKLTHTLSLLRYDLQKNEWADFPDKARFQVLSTQLVGPGSPDKRAQSDINLRGMALLNGKLYVSSRGENAILVVDPATGKRLSTLALPEPGVVATSGQGLLAVSKGAIVKLNPADGKTTELIAAGVLDPRGIAVTKSGNFYVSDEKTNTVKSFDPTGKPLKTIGTPGGEYSGAYDASRMVHPRGLAFGPDENLWVSEERWTPKRYSAWNPATGKIAREYFGRTAYASPGGGMDPQDPTRWAGLGALWQVDFETKTARPTSVLGAQVEALTPLHYRFVRRDGRTFLIGYGKCSFISELQKDGSVKDLAMVGTVSGYTHGDDWKLPAPFMEAYKTAYPENNGDTSKGSNGVLWVDKSGDGEMQADEFQFAKSASRFGGGYWGSDFLDLTLRLPATVDGKSVAVALEPQGYWIGGAPKYPDLETALKAAPVLQTLPGQKGAISVESMTDRLGNIYFNTDPKMSSYAPDGKLRWTYPNQWSAVHGSHNAPLPERGVLQGTLFFTGMAPLDDKTDVFVLNGNHGRLSAITSDGLYLDEMFRDVRMGGADDVYRAGGELFGGIFEKSQKDGKYYLQVGGNEYRIFNVSGLDTIQRSEGKFALTPAQAQAAERNLQQQAAKAEDKIATIPRAAAPPKIDGKINDWKAPIVAEWAKNKQFPVVVRVAYDDKNLYLSYHVSDGSPWGNNGTDWQTLFKTGDSIDLQLGTDAGAKAKRTSPVPGDLRVLIAPMGEKNVAVLYRHRMPGAKNPVDFTSPWRSEKVDVVKQLDNVQIGVEKGANWYNVEAAIPLSELGLTDFAGKTLSGDFGAIYGDTAGTVNNLRNYWSNQATGLVNDVPGEIMLSPNLWGALRFEKTP